MIAWIHNKLIDQVYLRLFDKNTNCMTCLVFVYELIPSGEDVSCESADLDTKVERVRKKRSMFEKASTTDPAPTSLSRKVNYPWNIQDDYFKIIE